MSSIEFKNLEFKVEDTKQIVINGQRIGVIKGHAAAFSLDRVNDRIERGAFLKTIQDHKDRNNRQIRMKFQHRNDELIGGFPIEFVREDDKGLFVEGHVNLEVQKGAESFSLAQQGILSDLSIGFIPDLVEFDNENNIRVIKQIDLREISLVDEPANMDATITEVKRVIPFQDLPLASEDMEWNSEKAVQRIREFTKALTEPNKDFLRAFLLFDSDDANNFNAYKLPIADVVDGQLKAVPKGIFAARGTLAGARGDEDIPASDRPRVEQNINKYFRKINREFETDLEIPFKSMNKENELKLETVRDVDTLLKNHGFSRNEAKTIISIIKGGQQDADKPNDKNQSELSSSSLALRDASVEKLDHILWVQKLDKIIQKCEVKYVRRKEHKPNNQREDGQVSGSHRTCSRES